MLKYWQSFSTGIQEKSMRAMLAIVLSLLFVSDALSAKNDLHSVCARTNRDEKFVMKLGRDGAIKLCVLHLYQANGEECESGIGGDQSWRLIADLNKDKHYDVIVGLSAGTWRGALPHMFFVNCGDDTFINIFDGYFTRIEVIQPTNKTKWLQFKTRVFNPNPEDDSTGDINDYILRFDEKKFTYTEAQTRSIKGPEISFTISTLMPNLVVPWGKFPTNLPPPKIIDDGTKEACKKNVHQLVGFSPDSRLCQYVPGKSCIAPTEDPTDYNHMEQIEWTSGKATGLYTWTGRFLFFREGNAAIPDFLTFSKNQTEIHGFGAYISCAPYNAPGFLRVMTGSFTDLKHDKPDEKHLWADIHATRQCLNKSTGQRQSRTFVLKFDKSKFEYGPPNGDPALVTPCSDKEMSLPFKEVK